MGAPNFSGLAIPSTRLMAEFMPNVVTASFVVKLCSDHVCYIASVPSFFHGGDSFLGLTSLHRHNCRNGAEI